MQIRRKKKEQKVHPENSEILHYSYLYVLHYSGGQNYEEAVNYIKLKFSELNLNPDKKTIYMHETCATDTNQVSCYG